MPNGAESIEMCAYKDLQSIHITVNSISHGAKLKAMSVIRNWVEESIQKSIKAATSKIIKNAS